MLNKTILVNDYSSKKRRQIIKTVWDTYHDRGCPEKMKVLKTDFTYISKSEEEVSDIIKSFCDIGCFAKWTTDAETYSKLTHRGTKNYYFGNIDKTKLEEEYQKNKPTFKKLKPQSIKLKNGNLIINTNTGEVKLNNSGNAFNPGSQEFKALLKLAENEDYQATYDDLLGTGSTKVARRGLTFTIRNIKETLGILPKKNAKNKDIIANIKNYGYRLIT